MTENAIDSQITVTLTIGLDTIVSTEHEYDRDGGYQGQREVTLLEAVAERIARQLTKDAREQIDYAGVRRRVDDAITEMVSVKLADFTEREIVPTDSYGNPKGPARTIAEEIVTAAAGWCNQPSGEYGRGGTRLQKIIREEIDRQFTKELKGAIDEAKATVTAKVRDHAAQLLADTLTAAGGAS
ncbi:hypothetical protein [Rhodococcus daqingensis]|uniref:Uncharacterized protein n=1 Tax=Rhodococcus daqingensis TaxID=2479363 RepID=A0ABW2S4P2_9NOCA